MTAYEWPSEPLVRERLHHWQDLKFGLIVHWGPYTQWGVTESWTLCGEDQPWCRRTGPHAASYEGYRQAYERLPETFAAPALDPEAWGALFRASGARYLVFTAKHHDGFCLFDTKETDYRTTAPASPLAGTPHADVLRAALDAARGQGLEAGVYFSKPDWHHPDYWWPYFPTPDRHVNYDPDWYPERWRRYQAFMHRQVEELVTGYGPLLLLWLDGSWVRADPSSGDHGGPPQDPDIAGMAAMARRHQPGLLVVDRDCGGRFENYLTPERTTPEETLDVPWESCLPLGRDWYNRDGDPLMPTSELVHTLVRTAARGGNLLLGVGPDHTGAFVPAVRERLAELGVWLERWGQAVFGTRPLPPHERGPLAYTQDAGAGLRYAIVEQPDGASALPAEVLLDGEVVPDGAEVRLLGGCPARWERRGDRVAVRLDHRSEPVPHAFALAIQGPAGCRSG